MSRRKPAAPFRKILCPVDFSAHAGGALRLAAEIADRSGGRLEVLFVSDPLLVAAAAAVYHRRAGLLRRTELELRAFAKRVLAGRPQPRGGLEFRAVVGDPADTILRAAAPDQCDLIVMGTQGLHGADKWFMGSTAEQVLAKAAVPVIAVPRGTRRTCTASFRRVVAPVDLRRGWRRDVAAAAGIARWLDAGLTLVHVIPPMPIVPWLGSPGGAIDRRRVAAARGALERAAARLTSRVKTTCKVVVGKPAAAIAAEAAATPSSLVVMALRGEEGFLGRRRGSIAYRILTRTAAPLFAVPAGARQAHAGRTAVRSARRVAIGLRDTVASGLRERDRLELEAVNALLSSGRAGSGDGRGAAAVG